MELTVKQKLELSLKRYWMSVVDHTTEAKLSYFKPRANLNQPINLPEHFNSERIRIFWPSFYSWPVIHKWLFPLLSEFRRNFVVEFKAMPYSERHVIYIEVEIDGKIYPIAIDAFDEIAIDEEQVSQVLVYFKMQYAQMGYPHRNVIPGGFIPAYSNIYLYLDRVRQLRDQQMFCHDSYGRFGGLYAKSIRGQAVEKLSSQNDFSYQGGIGRVSYIKSLYEIANSKVCIDLPGNGPLCFRLVDYLAVGSCIIAYPHQAKMPIPLTPGREIVYCKEDLSDLNELCNFYITHDTEREVIAKNARNYFDQHLSRPRLASYYINKVLEYAKN
jgi:Glycosyl transferases group 1